MFKSKSKWTGAVLALVMVLAFTTPIFADGEGDLVETPETVEETSNFFDHPIIKLIAEFFKDLFNPQPEVGGEDLPGEEPGFEEPSGGDDLPEGDPEPDPVPDPEPDPELEPLIIPEEAVAAMHKDEDLGFGEIVKLMGILESAQATCAESGGTDEVACGVTLESLIAEYKDGAGMGELFENYGKPENLGVGHIRKESELMGQILNEHTKHVKNEEKTNNGKALGKDK
jgi:hypothetical protein